MRKLKLFQQEISRKNILKSFIMQKETLLHERTDAESDGDQRKIIIMRVNHIDSESRRFEERTMWHLNYTELQY